ncbi:MAG: tyrosine-type recombinase/integrase, partial [Pseudonocardiaceae bacterium]
PEARPLTREELQRFLDYADDQVDRAVRAKRQGALAAYRDATLFKVAYGWGLRRTETAKLDVADWGRNPAAPEFGRYGMLHVRYGKAVRGQPPRRRNVPSVMGWAVEAVADYVENIRPRFGCADHPAMWVTERGGRVQPAENNARFVAYREALDLPKGTSPHTLRHSFVISPDSEPVRHVGYGGGRARALGVSGSCRYPQLPSPRDRVDQCRVPGRAGGVAARRRRVVGGARR